jgi:hypothetical protein
MAQIPDPQALQDFIDEQIVKDGMRIHLRDSLAQVYQLSIYDTCCGGSGAVLWTFENGTPIYKRTLDAHSASVSKTDKLYPGASLGLNLTGSTITIGIWDQVEPQMDHSEYNGRVLYKDSLAPSSLQNNPHFTNMLGILTATGLTGHESVRGMAYAAMIHAYDYSNGYVQDVGPAAQNGLWISNHSYVTAAGWGTDNPGCNEWNGGVGVGVDSLESYKFGYYDDEAMAWDELIALAPHHLMVTGAGNNRYLNTSQSCFPQRHWNGQSTYGYDVISNTGNAKNALVVGAIDEQSGTISLWPFSCAGPTDDGRIKPDMVALGVNVQTTKPLGGYDVVDGTSVSSAVATGSLALVQEYALKERQGWPLMASTLKALALGTATDLGRTGPDYDYGWGLLNTEAAILAVSEGKLHVHDSLLLEQSASIQIPVYYQENGDCSSPLKATICWTDPPATPIPVDSNYSINDPTPRLVNDVDVKIIQMSNQNEYYPWTLAGRSNATAYAARNARNSVDNVEQVCIDAPESGWYLIVIDHPSGHSLQGGEQVVSLVVTGNAKPPMLSSTAAATELNSQRKVDYDDGEWQCVHESDGEVWHAVSTNQGSTWFNERCLSRGSGVATRPSIYTLPGGSLVTWKDGNVIRFGMTRRVSDTATTQIGCHRLLTIADTAFFKLADYSLPPDVLVPTAGAAPVIASTGFVSNVYPALGYNAHTIVVYETEHAQGAGLAYLIFGDLDLLGYGLINGTGNGFDNPPVTPSIAFDRYKSFNENKPEFHLAWRIDSAIKYSKIRIDDFDPISISYWQEGDIYSDQTNLPTGAPSICPYWHHGGTGNKHDAVIAFSFATMSENVIGIAYKDSSGALYPTTKQYPIDKPDNYWAPSVMSFRRYHRDLDPNVEHDNIRCAFNHEDAYGNRGILVVQSNIGVWDVSPTSQISGAENPSLVAFPPPDDELELFCMLRQPGDEHTQLSATTYLLPKRTGKMDNSAVAIAADDLEQNSPNPFRAETLIHFVKHAAGPGLLTIHDILGRNIATLIDQMLEKGRYKVRLDGSSLAPGMYICRLATDRGIQTRILTRLK